jgi:hypothetical protein
MTIEYPSYNKIQEYITLTFEYANKYYSEIKRVYDVICSSENESDIRNTIIEIGKEIYNSGGEKAISGCIVIMILTNNIMLGENYSDELIKLYQSRVENIADYWANIGDL